MSFYYCFGFAIAFHLKHKIVFNCKWVIDQSVMIVCVSEADLDEKNFSLLFAISPKLKRRLPGPLIEIKSLFLSLN